MASDRALRRTDALRIVNEVFPDQPILVTLGGTVREMIAAGGRRANHLYMLDSMGLVAPIALGLALGLAQDPKVERVVALEGDGGLLMGFSVLSTIGHLRPKKLILAVLDNGVYLTTGGQPSASGSTDFVAAARACGLTAKSLEGPKALRAGLVTAGRKDGPWLLRVPVQRVVPTADLFLEDPVVLGGDFCRWLNNRPDDSRGC